MTDQVSLFVPGMSAVGSVAPITWTVDGIPMTDVSNPIKVSIQPWDSDPHVVVATSTVGAVLCQGTISIESVQKTQEAYVDVFPPHPEAERIADSVSVITPSTVISAVHPQTMAAGGSISGYLNDPLNGATSNAQVAVTNLDSKATLVTKTDAQGTYLVQDLPPGKYSVAVTVPGFSTYTVPSVYIAPLGGVQTTPVKVYYATERQQTGTVDRIDFGANRSPDRQIHYGVAVVAVPNHHPRALLGDTRYWSYQPKSYAASFSPFMQRDDFLDNIGAQAAQQQKKSILLFVHGFRNAFIEDIYKAASLSYDTGQVGVPVLFDWPSATPKINLISGYISDLAALDSSEQDFEVFLEKLSTSSKGATINIVAHSMGNRLLLRVLDSMRTRNTLPRIGQIVMAAPDVDAELFSKVMDPLLATHKVAHVTMYGSNKDLAMALSKQAHLGHSAVGSMPPVQPLVGIDQVDVSGLKMNIVGHDYFITTQPVLSDLSVLLRDGKAAPRSNLIQANQGQIVYWKMTESPLD